MPKMKTNKGAAKRFKVTGSGKIVRKKAYLRHQLSCKTRKAKRHLRHSAVVDAANAPAIRKLLPYL
ncbi:MAG: 50S ribosomal protein L35 [Deltaproteobacteria bacterium]|nr:50S ribosomal protein L35 [Deltaproteobacteria bacterium]